MYPIISYICSNPIKENHKEFITMNKESLMNLAGIFQEEFQGMNEHTNVEPKLGGEFWYE